MIKIFPFQRTIFWIGGIIFGLIFVSYIVLFLYAEKIQNFIAFPGAKINLKQITNHPAGVTYGEEIDIVSRDGKNIHGLYLDNNAQKTVYYFHGNGAPMNHFYTEMRYIADLGYNVMSYDFPWYGKSEGESTQQEIYNFSHDFYTYMQSEKWFTDSDVIVWGYSVGSAIAIDFVWDRQFDSLVLFAPFASLYDMSRKVFGIALQRLFFLPNTFVSVDTISSIRIPTLVIHGNVDIVVPFEQGKRVFQKSGATKKAFLEIDNFGHSLITERYGDVLAPYIQQFLAEKTLEEEYVFLDRSTAREILEHAQYIKNVDLFSDTALEKFVSPDVPFEELSYVPPDLEYLGKEFIIDTKWNAQLRKEAKQQLEHMAEKFYEEFQEKMVAVSTYRSYTYQAGIKARGCPDNLCAKAGHSEHQSGLAVDFWSASTNAYWQSSPRLMKYYRWLSENAHMYGFHNTYQRGREIDGYEIEPWHWRYMWVTLATYLHEQDLTFAEFYKKREK